MPLYLHDKDETYILWDMQYLFQTKQVDTLSQAGQKVRKQSFSDRKWKKFVTKHNDARRLTMHDTLALEWFSFLRNV